MEYKNAMKLHNKKLFFVKEMPASEEQDVTALKKVSKRGFEKLLKDSKKPKSKNPKAA